MKFNNGKKTISGNPEWTFFPEPPQKKVIGIQLKLNKWNFGESMVLVVDTRSNMTSKYGANLFIIGRHYQWEDRKIDATRHDARTMTPEPAL